MKMDIAMCMRPFLRRDKHAPPRGAGVRNVYYTYMKTGKDRLAPKTPVFKENRMLNWIVTYFMLAVLAAVGGFGGPVGWAEDVAKSLSVLFVILFAGAILYGVVGGRARTTLL